MAGPWRVLHVHNRYRNTQPSGENIRVAQEAALLESGGHFVSLLEYDNTEIESWSHRQKAALPFRAVWSRRAYGDTSKAIQDFAPDLVHVHNFLPLASPSVLWAAKSLEKPIVCTLANYRLMCPTATFFRDGHRCEECKDRLLAWPGIQHKCYRESRPASAVVAATTGIHKLLGTWDKVVDLYLIASSFGKAKYCEGGFNPKKIVVKPNTARELGVKRRGPGQHYLFAGRLDEEKGVYLLLDAWARADLRPGRELHIAGDGPRMQDLKETVSKQGIKGVRFLGYLDREQLAKEVERSRALVSPSITYEVSSLSTIEAMSAGVTSIVSKGGGQEELVEEGRSGLTCSVSSSDDLTSHLQRLENDDLSVSLGRNARRRYEKHHSPKVVLVSLEAAYESVLIGS